MSRRPRIIVSVDRTWVHLLGLTRLTYHRLLRRAGARPINVRYPLTDPDPADARRMIATLDRGDGLLLAGGGDVDPTLYGVAGPAKGVKPERDRFEITLLGEAARRRMPVLGICRGAQLMNVARGGTLRSLRDDRSLMRRHGRMRTHGVDLSPASRIAKATDMQRLPRIRSLHGQAVDRVADGLHAAARADDGVIEAIESSPDDIGSGWFVGVQWHPELMLFVQPDRQLIRRFTEAARRFAP